MIKKPFFWLILAAVTAWAAVFSASWRTDQLHLVFCDVGQGDAILAIYGSTQILIDGGSDKKVLSCLSRYLPFWDRTIEVAINTHAEADHLTGINFVIERYNVEQIISNSLMVNSGVFGKFRDLVTARQVPVFSPQHGDKIEIGKLNLKILFPEEKLGNELVWVKSDSPSVLGLASFAGKLNETSIVSQLSFGNFDALLTGDIDFDIEKKLSLPAAGVIEVLKVAHHGSKYSTGEDFLAAIHPALAVISVGKNSYGHPTEEALARLRDSDIRILRTDQGGDIEIVSDGKSWQILK